jgi:hypothetical protein
MFVDDPQPGFYRQGVYEKQENKARKRVGWSPVAIFHASGELTAQVGQHGNETIITDRDRINELWSYCAANPISEEWFRSVSERGERWPDSHETVASIPVANSSGSLDRTEMIIQNRKQALDVIAADVMDPHGKIIRELADSEKLLAKYATIDSDEMAAKARSLQNRFLDLRGEAGKHYEAANRPLLEQQKKLRELWFPLRDAADEASSTIKKAMGAWEDEKRKAARLAAEAAEKAAREHAEATAKAAAANQPAPPPPEPVKSNVPPPAAQIRGGAGRAAHVNLVKFVTEIDVDRVFQQFREAPEVIKVLSDLAQKAVRAGIAVPGATVEEKSDVR